MKCTAGCGREIISTKGLIKFRKGYAHPVCLYIMFTGMKMASKT